MQPWREMEPRAEQPLHPLGEAALLLDSSSCQARGSSTAGREKHLERKTEEIGGGMLRTCSEFQSWDSAVQNNFVKISSVELGSKLLGA